MPNVSKATMEKARRLHAEGATDSITLADALGVSARTAEHCLTTIRGGPTRKPVTPEQMARIELLVRERLPAAWIAEDVRVASSTVHAARRRLNDRNSDFSKVWGAIRVNPKMLELHREFAPKARDHEPR